jgi:hypothetical protein
VGLVSPKPGSPSLLGVSPTLWFIVVGLLLVWAFLERESRMEERNEDPLVKPSMFSNRQMTGGLLMFLLLYLVRRRLPPWAARSGASAPSRQMVRLCAPGSCQSAGVIRCAGTVHPGGMSQCPS